MFPVPTSSCCFVVMVKAPISWLLMQCWPCSLGHRTFLVRCSVGRDYLTGLGISWASHKAHCPVGPLLSWLKCHLSVVAWDLRLSAFKHLCTSLLKITPAFQNIEFFNNVHGVTRMRAVLHLGKDRYRFRVTVYFRKFCHDTSIWGRRKEKERWDFRYLTRVSKNQCSVLGLCSVP